MLHSTFQISDFQYLRALGKLFPLRLLHQAVTATARTTTRQRCLPGSLLLGCLIAWFFHASSKLPFIVHWLCSRPKDLPSDSALYQTRARLGWAPLRWLRQRVVRPLADLCRDPYAFYAGHRLLALDGTTFTLADSAANDRTFGRARNQHGRSGYPLMRVVALCEVGTHTLWRWLGRAFRVSEQVLAARLYRHIPAGSLLLADRGFHSYTLWQAAVAGGWEVLLRVQAGPKFVAEQVLADGSILSWVYPRRGKHKQARGVRVRVIRYSWTDQHGKERNARLLTSLVDATAHPARVLLGLYHQRWEQEGVFREIKSALAGRATQMRAHDPQRVLQELEGMLLGHFVVRWVMLEAARERGLAAVEVSFTGTLRLLQTRWGAVPATPRQLRQWWAKLLQAVSREKVQKRRARCCPRKKKVTRAAWRVKRATDRELPLPALTLLPHPLP
jgi:hypothetical protein